VNGRKKLTTTQIFLGILVILVTLFSISGLIKFTGYLTTVERITLLDYLKGIFLFFILSVVFSVYFRSIEMESKNKWTFVGVGLIVSSVKFLSYYTLILDFVREQFSVSFWTVLRIFIILL
jgi:hypothetical protein